MGDVDQSLALVEPEAAEAGPGRNRDVGRGRSGRRTRGSVLHIGMLMAFLFGGMGGAHAQNFDFTYLSNGLRVMGTFVTTAQGNGSYLITSILNGMRGNNTIALLAPNAYQNNNNILRFPASPTYVDLQGVSYASAGVNYNLFSLGGSYFEDPSNAILDRVVTDFRVAPAPLPGGGLLSFLALGLFGAVHRRRVILGSIRAHARLGRDVQPAARTT